MNLYEKYLLPRVVSCVCGLQPMMRQRAKVVPLAKGTVVELGIGSGLNIPYYDKNLVTHLIGIDPTPHTKKLNRTLELSTISSEMIFESAETLAMEDDSIDTIVTTYTFCTIPELRKTLSECRRVLKDQGSLIFIEHGLAPDAKVQRTQNKINPYWKKIAGGCHLNRDIPLLMNKEGFQIPKLESMYLPGWKPATWNVWGVARKG